MVGELLLVLVIILVLFGPGRLAEMPGRLAGRKPEPPIRPSREPAARPNRGGAAQPAAATARGRAGGSTGVLKLAWKWSNAAGWVMIVGGLGLIVGDLFWWHVGLPVQGPALLFLILGPWLIF